jgi:membrane associated rhomboid family serine protease
LTAKKSISLAAIITYLSALLFKQIILISITLIIILVNVVVSFIAFQNQEAFSRLCFWPEKVWHEKQWYRLLSGAFLHANMPHLLFNMITLYFFGPIVEYSFMEIFGSAGHSVYVGFYILAVLIANVPDLLEHKDDSSYRAVGASGAVSAVIFASILFNPLSSIYIFFIPIGIPAYIFGIFYLIYSAYMARAQQDNIGHLAHFSGAVFGVVFPLLFQPALLIDCLHKILGR